MAESSHRYAFTRISSNSKTGPMPVTSTSRDSCPATCSFLGNGCYAEIGPLSWHWRKLDSAGLTLDELCAKVKALPKGSPMRHNQAGDLPTTGDGLIDAEGLSQLADASRRVQGFTYTHHSPWLGTNGAAVLAANQAGFTVNLSAESLYEADALADLDIGPVVVAVPRGTPKVSFTPKGRQVTMCPAVYSDRTCLDCMVCAKAGRKAVIAFEAHGTSAKRVEAVFWAKQA